MNKSISQPRPITLVWEKITAKVNQKTILNDISGYCKPGQMLAIMGPSGAGKTTLLSLLASKRNKALTIEGNVFANNESFSAEQFYNFGVYIFQNDILHANLTVKQTLSFISRLQIKDPKLCEDRVQEMISTFQLQKCSDTYIGGLFTKGISGGQKKRVCIAVEMISNPQVLILDEPTSGLDSHKVGSVLKALQKLARQKNKTVIFTLHQPSFLIYKSLDRLMLLNKGQIIYQGLSKDVYSYMQDSLKITVPLNCTISDFFMMQISQYKQSKQNYTTSFNHQNYCLRLESQQLQSFQKTKSEALDGYTVLKTSKSFVQQFLILIQREWIIFKRSPMKGIRVLLGSLLIVIMGGFVFLNGVSDKRPIQSDKIYNYQQTLIYFIRVQAITYFGVLSCIMSACNTVVLSFPTDKQIYYKQTSSKKYRSISYLISKIITQAGSTIMGATIFSLGQYFLVGYTISFEQLIKFFVTMITCSLVGNSLGFFLGSMFKDARRASALTPIILMPLMMFSGVYNRLDSLQDWIGWVQYISPFKYALHCILVNQYGNEVYLTQKGWFDYREDLLIQMDYQQNEPILISLALFFYAIGFILLKKLSSNLAP